MKLPKIYEDLVQLPGISGQEHYVSKYIEEELKKYSDEFIKDKLGSIFAIKKSKVKNAPKVMLCGHMDEVGAIVTKISKEGLLELNPIGGINSEVFVSQLMNVVIDEKNSLPGVTVTIPSHLGKEKSKKVYSLDIGASSKEEALDLGVKIGQQVVFSNTLTYTKNGKNVISKAWDDRFGCALAIEILKELKDVELDIDLYVGATVQEEVGLRGAVTATHLIDPDMFITIDTSPVDDTTNVKEPISRLGEGFLLRLKDPGILMNRNLVTYIEDLAIKNKIKYQPYFGLGGTDAVRAQTSRSGVIATSLNIPARYIHSTISMINIEDYKTLKKYIKLLIMSLNVENIDKIRYNL